ncbi:MAG: GNAT family N-acetyltransferase [Phycisphaeraceae bacterium]|nr:GNAT family N-acetyltransferase [Phycisphaeraceae bacterium]
MSITIRRLAPIDALDYVTLRREMLADSPWSFLASPEQDRGCDLEKVRASLAREDAAIFAVREGDRLVAAAGVVRDEALKKRHIATIWGVYVAPGARGRGLGRAVVCAAMDAARSWPGVGSIHLAVSSNAPLARRLYDSLGFREWGYEPDAVRINGVSYGEHHMAMALDKQP